MEQQMNENGIKKKFNLAALFAPTDMTEGSPGKRIVAFAIPMLIGNIAQQLYNTVDSIVVGRYVGDNALAAVGSASPILNLLLVLFVGISVGASIMVSQYFGGKAERGTVRLHRMQHYADSHFFRNYHDTGAAGGQAAAEAPEYAGQHYGLVCLLSDNPLCGNRRYVLL